ncbi:nitrogen regulation protein NR(II) [Notoacmeibacter sp. MSK16QG-6]|uniref:two-component system sensor histidine kinase NtrB n=1 Tax=Notoacmeibacter sp. MSK16QG-6 TaxID=2957982 RepID=UPI00209E56FB|nr:nitrogen regulation protein NR(II) [Notoacmeibacter sp. MSK16QG-6]MCP1200759.1 nitrogen regulation protein NR(II) [Notoacmeibacter sp. MSK16QG-6]
MTQKRAIKSAEPALAESLLNAIQQPIALIDGDGTIAYANADAESLFRSSASVLQRMKLADFIPFDSPLMALIDQVRQQGAPVTEYRVDISSPRIGADRLVDLYVGPVPDQRDAVLVVFQERSMADKIDRQMTHRGAARSVTGLAAMLAHEIKNPLSGIRGAAQLLESSVDQDDRPLTRLIMEETDRIVGLVDRMEIFSDERPVEKTPVNIHVVFDHVRAIAKNGFAKDIVFEDFYDPSLPPVFGNRDQLIQIFLNLIKNAAEAVAPKGKEGKITLTTAFRPGIRLSVPGSKEKVSLPMEFCVHDNGPGVPDDMFPYIFDPFITSKINGSGLGLALVAKLVGEHGGVVECDSSSSGTTFRVLMPAWKEGKAAPAEAKLKSETAQ